MAKIIQERKPWLEQLKMVGGLVVPNFLTLVFFAASVVSFHIPGSGAIKPLFIMMPIYYWAIYRPTMLPASVTFLCGLLYDLLSAMPLGLHALLFLAVHETIRRHRRLFMAQNFAVLWIFFLIACTFVNAARWVLMDLLYLNVFPVSPVLFQTLVTVAFFPVATLLLNYAHRMVSHSESVYSRRI